MDIPAGWTLEDGGAAITREFTFDGFVAAMAFMAGVVPHCERANHHPEWSNVYATVNVRLTTHSAGGLTDKDTVLAAAMDTVARAVGLSD